MNVLSLFDGMGCAWIALRELGIKVGKGYSSEIDKHAVHQVEVNFPEVERLGSVTEVDVSKLEKIDLLMGGSPCQSFSFAGKRKGMATTENEEIYTLERYLELKRQGFRFEGQSYLFWEYMRILEDIRNYNQDVLFLLENVEMGSKWERVLNEAIGIRGVHINSDLVSAQNRKRIYWTNIRVRHDGLFGEAYSDIPQPEDRGILLKDVLEEEVDGKYFLSGSAASGLMKNLEVDNEGGLICAAMRGRETACLTTKRNEYGKAIRKDYEEGRVKEQRKNIQQLEPRMDGKTNALTTVTKDNLVLDGGGLFCIRRLTPTECARLQTIPGWYKWDVSETQQYKMLGNGWTVEVIKHILSFIKKN